MTKDKTEPQKSNNEKILLMLAYLCIKDMETLKEKVEFLDMIGFSTQETASFLKVKDTAVYTARKGNK